MSFASSFGFVEMMTAIALLVASAIAVNTYRTDGLDSKKPNEYKALIVSLVSGILLMLICMFMLYKTRQSYKNMATGVAANAAARAGAAKIAFMNPTVRSNLAV